MVDHTRRHKVPSVVQLQEIPESGLGQHTEKILDGMQQVRAIAALVESTIVWRAQHIAWNVDLYQAERLLYRLIYKEGSRNPQAMDLLARIYFQQGRYEKAKDLFFRASELQPGNPALRRTANLIQSIVKSPANALLFHRIGVFLRGVAMVALLCLVGWGGIKGHEAYRRWSEGPIAVQNLVGRFHYDYDSITKDLEYVPSEWASGAKSGEDGTYRVGFTRRKLSNNREIGRIEVTVERTGNSLKATGNVPNLHVRYLVEQALWEVPGITDVDMRNLIVDRSYRVAKGDSLWIIARRLYGEGSSWTVLAKFNDLRNPSKLRIGQALSLPLGDEKLEPGH